MNRVLTVSTGSGGGWMVGVLRGIALRVDGEKLQKVLYTCKSRHLPSLHVQV
ncbi:MAG: hypothetical protein ACTSWP_10205 [Candidatus Freyarchaeota archaeon]|nr:hypothetical protein [Candidatus Freyrarchaeum guaymaensis]